MATDWQAGDVLQFALNVGNQSSPPQLISLTPGVTITLDPSTSGAAAAPALRARLLTQFLSHSRFCSGRPWPVQA